MNEDNIFYYSGKWTRTEELKERLSTNENSRFQDGQLFFNNRPIVQRDSNINGHICMGAYQREAVIVDDDYDPILNKVGKDFIEYIFREDILDSPFCIIRSAYFKAINIFKIHDIDAYVQQYRQDSPLYLGSFIGYQLGNCVHKALLTAYLIELSEKVFKFGGKISVDRNSWAKWGAHAWARYTFPKTELVYILDPSKLTEGFLLLMNQIPNCEWLYHRPEDIVQSAVENMTT